MSSLIRDWRELRRAWKRFAAALLSISADDLARPDGREVTSLGEVTRLDKAQARNIRERYIDMLNELSEAALLWAKGGTIAEIQAASDIIRNNTMRIEDLMWPIENAKEQADEGKE